MRHSGLSVRRAVDIRVAPPTRSDPGNATRARELELKLAALQAENSHLQAALSEAARLHRRLCAPRLVSQGDFVIASEIFAVHSLPGDFFVTIKEDPDEGIILALGDICGKGLAAAMWATCLVGLVGAYARVTSDPHAIVAGVNREVCRMSSVAPQATLFLARLNPATGRLDYCSAGHPPSLLLRADAQLETLNEGGTLLGALPEASFDAGRAVMRAGDLLLAYSDGVLEARNSADEEFGSERLEMQLCLARTGSADAVLFSVLGAVQDFAAPRSLADDTSLVVVQHAGNGGRTEVTTNGGRTEVTRVSSDR